MILLKLLTLAALVCVTQAYDIEDLPRKFKDLEDRMARLDDELEDRVAKLEDLAKVGTLRSCSEYAQYGLKTSGPYLVDPDGALVGQEPFQVFCNFTTGATEVMHDTENTMKVEHCHDPGCWQKNITYINGLTHEPVSPFQIVSLIELAAYCEQEFRYDCTLAPLTDNDINYAFWQGRQGEDNIYFTGENFGYHVCDCHYAPDGCMEESVESNTCNCDANLPIPMSDTGTITNMTALPVMKLAFGGLNYDLQSATFQLGRLKCYGDKDINIGESCSAIKRKGEMTSGYYNIRPEGSEYTKIVFCDMKSGTYTDVPQVEQMSASSPLGTILAWVPKPEASLSAQSLTEGWIPCDGSSIPKGPWAGGKTPDLNSVGAFLRGGLEDKVLEMEEDQVEDHHHEDSGHQHSCTASSSAGSHTHSYRQAAYDNGESPAEFCDHYSHNCDSYAHLTYTHSATTYSATPSVSTTCSTTKHSSDIGGVTSASRRGTETRPRNMKVRYVMKCW